MAVSFYVSRLSYNVKDGHRIERTSFSNLMWPHRRLVLCASVSVARWGWGCWGAQAGAHLGAHWALASCHDFWWAFLESTKSISKQLRAINCSVQHQQPSNMYGTWHLHKGWSSSLVRIQHADFIIHFLYVHGCVLYMWADSQFKNRNSFYYLHVIMTTRCHFIFRISNRETTTTHWVEPSFMQVRAVALCFSFW